MKKTYSDNEKHLSLKFCGDFRPMGELFRNQEKHTYNIPIKSTLFKQEGDPNSGIKEELIIHSKGLKTKVFDFFLSIICIASHEQNLLNGEKCRFLLTNDQLSSKRSENMYNQIFDAEARSTDMIDLKLKSIVISTDHSYIFKLTGIRKKDFYCTELREALLDLASIVLIHRHNKKEIATKLLGYIFDEERNTLDIILHPRLSQVILDNNKFYKHMKLDQHLKLKHHHSKLANFNFSTWLFQSSGGDGMRINTLLHYIVHDYDKKSLSNRKTIKSNFIKYCIPELISIGWDIRYEKKSKANGYVDDMLFIRHRENTYKKKC